MQVSGRYFTGRGAVEISKELTKMFRDHESSPISADNSKYQELTHKWLVLVRCVFPKKLFLDKGTHILYLVYYNYHGMHI